MGLGLGVVFFAVPLYAIRLGATVFSLGLLGSIIFLCYALTSPFTGIASDRWGRKLVLATGWFIQSSTFLVMGLVEQVTSLLILYGLCGVGMALVYPPFQAWFADVGVRGGGTNLARGLGVFVICMLIGITLGPSVGGLLFEIHPSLPFFFAPLPTSSLLLLIRNSEIEENALPPEKAAGERGILLNDSCLQDSFLHAAWVANFASGFMGSIIASLFPKLVTVLGFTPRNIGFLFFLLSGSQTAIYYFLKNRDLWHYKLSPLIFCQSLGAGALLCISFAQSSQLLGLSLVFLGACRGMTSYSSLYYSLREEESRGKRSGMQESILASAYVFGPLIGGMVAKEYTLTTPYLICFLVIMGAIVVEILLVRQAWKRLNLRGAFG